MRTDNEQVRSWFEDDTDVEPELDDDEMIQLFNEGSRGVVWANDGAYLG